MSPALISSVGTAAAVTWCRQVCKAQTGSCLLSFLKFVFLAHSHDIRHGLACKSLPVEAVMKLQVLEVGFFSSALFSPSSLLTLLFPPLPSPFLPSFSFFSSLLPAFFFLNSVLLHSPDWPGTCCMSRVVLKSHQSFCLSF